MADAIFISYRRDDSEGEAGRLFADLTRAFGNDAVFMDVAGIKPGVDFRRAIEDNVAVCGVFLAIIGPTWATITDSKGVRRLDDPSDFVALELSSALSRQVPVIPILVHEAKMPSVEQLPESLKSFCYRNSVELSHTRWSSDVQLLIQALKPYIEPPKVAAPPPVHTTIPVQLPPPHSAQFRIPQPPPKKSKTPWILGISVAAILTVAAIGLIGLQENNGEQKPYFPANGSLVQPGVPGTSTSESSGSSKPLQQAVISQQHPGIEGRWHSPVQRTSNSLQRLVISSAGNMLLMHPYGACEPVECDWGTQPIIFDGAEATSVFQPQPFTELDGSVTNRIVRIVAIPTSGGLNITLQNQYQNPLRGETSRDFNLILLRDR